MFWGEKRERPQQEMLCKKCVCVMRAGRGGFDLRPGSSELSDEAIFSFFFVGPIWACPGGVDVGVGFVVGAGVGAPVAVFVAVPVAVPTGMPMKKRVKTKIKRKVKRKVKRTKRHIAVSHLFR